MTVFPEWRQHSPVNPHSRASTAIKEGIIFIPNLKMRELRLRETK